MIAKRCFWSGGLWRYGRCGGDGSVWTGSGSLEDEQLWPERLTSDHGPDPRRTALEPLNVAARGTLVRAGGLAAFLWIRLAGDQVSFSSINWNCKNTLPMPGNGGSSRFQPLTGPVGFRRFDGESGWALTVLSGVVADRNRWKWPSHQVDDDLPAGRNSVRFRRPSNEVNVDIVGTD